MIQAKRNNSIPRNSQDLFTDSDTLSKNRRVYTVSEITQDIKSILENTFGQVWVEGEVSGIRRIPSGTVFFNLKDNASILKCVIFASSAKSIKFEIKDGLKAVCSGRIGVYEKEGQYQLYTDKVEPKGIGSLQLALEQLKERLEKEGLFRKEHKRPIPYLPSRIGLVTSLSGAAIKDILKVLERRFGDTHIIINPAQVQGDAAKEEIAQAIKDLNRLNEELPRSEQIEVMIVGRGGGSIEDLWAFNEEVVARAIYNSRIPVISAVGHERDWTIADLVSDLRAATPSVAAEIVVPRKEDLEEKLSGLIEDLKRVGYEAILDLKEGLGNLIHRLRLANPITMLKQHLERIGDFARQLTLRISHFLKLKQAEFTKAAEKLSGLSPLNILGRGYSITFGVPGEEIIKDAASVKIGTLIKTRVHKGIILSQVKEAKRDG